MVWGSLIGFYAILAFVCLGILFSANIWYGADSIQARLNLKGQTVTSVESKDRNFFGYSEISVIEGAKEKRYLVDTNMLAMYTFHPVE